MKNLHVNAALVNQHKIPTLHEGMDRGALKEKTDAFEAIIVKMLLDNAMKDDKDIFSAQSDPGNKIYKSMYRDELSKASAGSFGFSEMLFDHLSEKI